MQGLAFFLIRLNNTLTTTMRQFHRDLYEGVASGNFPPPTFEGGRCTICLNTPAQMNHLLTMWGAVPGAATSGTVAAEDILIRRLRQVQSYLARSSPLPTLRLNYHRNPIGCTITCESCTADTFAQFYTLRKRARPQNAHKEEIASLIAELRALKDTLQRIVGMMADYPTTGPMELT
jgi:hypothetical protein